MNKEQIRKIVDEVVEVLMEGGPGSGRYPEGSGKHPRKDEQGPNSAQGHSDKRSTEQIQRDIKARWERVAKMKQEKRASKDEAIRSKVRAEAAGKQKKNRDDETKRLRAKKEWRASAKERSEKQQKKARDDEWKRQKPSAADRGRD
jgi:hypothetical protein